MPGVLSLAWPMFLSSALALFLLLFGAWQAVFALPIVGVWVGLKACGRRRKREPEPVRGGTEGQGVASRGLRRQRGSGRRFSRVWRAALVTGIGCFVAAALFMAIHIGLRVIVATSAFLADYNFERICQYHAPAMDHMVRHGMMPPHLATAAQALARHHLAGDYHESSAAWWAWNRLPKRPRTEINDEVRAYLLTLTTAEKVELQLAAKVRHPNNRDHGLGYLERLLMIDGDATLDPLTQAFVTQRLSSPYGKGLAMHRFLQVSAGPDSTDEQRRELSERIEGDIERVVAERVEAMNSSDIETWYERAVAQHPAVMDRSELLYPAVWDLWQRGLLPVNQRPFAEELVRMKLERSLPYNDPPNDDPTYGHVRDAASRHLAGLTVAQRNDLRVAVAVVFLDPHDYRTGHIKGGARRAAVRAWLRRGGGLICCS